MQSMNVVESKRGVVAAALLAMALFLVAGQASATPAEFDSSGWGFDPATLGGLTTGTIDGGVPFLDAGDPSIGGSLDVELTGYAEGSVCFLSAGDNVCQVNADSIAGPYSALVTLQISVVNTTDITGPFTLLLTSLGASYDPSEVTIELNPTAPAGLDASALSNFLFPGTFSNAVRVEDLTFAGMGTVYDYVGWTTEDGGLVSFRYDVSTSGGARGAPELFMNAVPTVVPEPGTALLLGLGLAGLAAAGRRVPAREDLDPDFRG